MLKEAGNIKQCQYLLLEEIHAEKITVSESLLRKLDPKGFERKTLKQNIFLSQPFDILIVRADVR